MKKFKGLLSFIVISAVAIAAVLLLVFLQRGETVYNSPTLFAMDTNLNVTIQGRSADAAKKDVDAAFALVRKLEATTSIFIPSSDTSRINAKAGIEPVKVEPETLEIVERSLEFSNLTAGAYDITVAPLVELWGFYDKNYRVPAQGEIEKSLRLVDYNDVKVNRSRGTVMLTRRGMKIDLGGVTKGYATGAVCDLLKKRGVTSALVNFGGSVGAIGRRKDGHKWVVGIRDPRGKATDLAGEIEIEDSYVSTSGDYERFFTSGGKRYCHILHPGVGRQPELMMSDTVTGPDAMNTDILSTSVFVTGKEKGTALVDGLHYGVFIVDSSGTVSYNPEMRKLVVTAKKKV